MSAAAPPGAEVAIVGAGPVGALLAILLARQGRAVRVFERRRDPRGTAQERGRSINLSLSARGLHALERAGVRTRIEPHLVAMPGRLLHDAAGGTRFLRYSQHAHQVHHSISRALLNRLLIEAAAATPGIELQFGWRCIDADPARGHLRLREEASGAGRDVDAAAIIAADGAGSAVRAALLRRALCQASEDALEHDYKEIEIAAAGGQAQLRRDALHVWPRGDFMLIALPNADGSFTATLFLPRTGPAGFAALGDAAAVAAFFAREFPDVPPLVPDLAAQFASHPQGGLATLRCWPWHAGTVLLIGDAAHAIVPFHGQGLNCGFEDCVLLAELAAVTPDLPACFAAFERERLPNTDAIAHMSLENYLQMRDTVRDARYAERQALSEQLERLHPGRFIPRYSMVMFHAGIPYAEALRRGALQERLLDALLASGRTHPPDATLVRHWLEQVFPPHG
ncbi:MAG: FAD-dependent monooxygenase [Gammaproteobacteria bacterium]|nr:FAD-dependent monooxygenase [Gammaproteobacteria bacterium]